LSEVGAHATTQSKDPEDALCNHAASGSFCEIPNSRLAFANLGGVTIPGQNLDRLTLVKETLKNQ
jgi:hypothetical protein